MPELAIVVPAYKAAFLEPALASIAAQRDRRFALYVFDDASPAPLEAICRRALAGMPFAFHRHADNLGRRDLVAHWNRCVRATSEPWVWVFGDDDLMDADCVERLRETLARTAAAFPVYRFDTRLIDDGDRLIRHSMRLAEREPAIEFALERLAGRRDSCLSSHVFSRAAFDAAGGFQPLPLAWCADDAAWVAFARGRDLCTVRGGEVAWRLGAANISGASGAGAHAKLDAAIAYLAWLRGEIASGRATPCTSRDLRRFEAAWPRWLVGQIRSQRIVLRWREAFALAARLRRALDCPAGEAMAVALRGVASPQRAVLVRACRNAGSLLRGATAPRSSEEAR